MARNTSYKVQADVDSDQIRNQYNIEEGAFVHTESGVWTVYNGNWVKLYPQSGVGSGLGWVRYDDTQYTSLNKLQLLDQVTVTMPNNGGNVFRSESGLEYYNSATKKIIATNVNDVYVVSVVFKMSAANANQTHLDFSMSGGGDLNRIEMALGFYKGNNTEQNVHRLVQFYTDQDFVTNGASFNIQAHGGTAKIWDVIYFIQKTQSYA